MKILKRLNGTFPLQILADHVDTVMAMRDPCDVLAPRCHAGSMMDTMISPVQLPELRVAMQQPVLEMAETEEMDAAIHEEAVMIPGVTDDNAGTTIPTKKVHHLAGKNASLASLKCSRDSAWVV